MKKIILMLTVLLAGFASNAQKRVVIQTRPVVRPHVVYYASPGFGYGYNPYYYRPWYYNTYNPYNSNYYNRPTKLDIEIKDMENEYSDRIESVRLDDSLSGKERRKIIRELRNERDERIYDLKKNYYKQN